MTNLYKYHSDPETLLWYNEAFEVVPELIWEKHRNNIEELKKRELPLAKDARTAYWYALWVLNMKPFPLGEPAIAKDAKYSCAYALNVLETPFPLGEPAIAKHAGYSHWYALNIIKGPFPLGEEVIVKHTIYNE
jgi:hypothetical protein